MDKCKPFFEKNKNFFLLFFAHESAYYNKVEGRPEFPPRGLPFYQYIAFPLTVS